MSLSIFVGGLLAGLLLVYALCMTSKFMDCGEAETTEMEPEPVETEMEHQPVSNVDWDEIYDNLMLFLKGMEERNG